ncbi:MAG: class I SAM-dependent methyltransferase [Candidatus Omnitrophica bacterium]|nr:class I SAM-dependent methyltransferase [Candidatus Omnitrophota bacterium]
MKQEFIDYLICPACKSSSFKVIINAKNDIEIREGFVKCKNCLKEFSITKGVLSFLCNPSHVVERGQQGWIEYDCQPNALPFKVEDMYKYESQLLSLPDGDGSGIFNQETIFRNIRDAANAFYQGLSELNLTGNEKLLDLGSDICWSTNKFAKAGCKCVALDINHHLPVSDLYIHKNNVYFERIIADMSDLPFNNGLFDLVVTITSLHHTSDLESTLKQISRVLKPSGKALFVNEPIRGIFHQIDFGDERSKELNLNDHWYTAKEYFLAAKKAGLRLRFRPYFLPVSSSDKLWKRMLKNLILKCSFVIKNIDIPVFLLLFYPTGKVMIAQKVQGGKI